MSPVRLDTFLAEQGLTSPAVRPGDTLLAGAGADLVVTTLDDVDTAALSDGSLSRVPR